MRQALVILSLLLLVACGGTASRPVTERLNGKWSNELVVYQFDFAKNTVTQTALGKTTEKPFTIVSADDTSVVVRTDGEPITIRLVDENTATIAQAGKVPLQVKRSP